MYIDEHQGKNKTRVVDRKLDSLVKPHLYNM